MIHETKPDLIIECGTSRGGSAYFFANICDLLGHGRIVTIDVEILPGRADHPCITYLHGSSTDDKIVDQVMTMTDGHVCAIAFTWSTILSSVEEPCR